MLRTMMPGGVPSNSRARNLRDTACVDPVRQPRELFLALICRRAWHAFKTGAAEHLFVQVASPESRVR